jgi:hypothetical protein
LIEAFHASVQLERAVPLTTVGELRAVVARKVAEETELCVTPRYFNKLAGAIDSVGHVYTELKRGRASNELTVFRFDVTLLGRARLETPAESTVIDWAGLCESTPDASAHDRLLALALRLEQIRETPLVVAAIPNQRLIKPLAQLHLLNTLPADATAWDLERYLWRVDDGHAVNPEDVAGLAERLGLEVRLLVDKDGRMDVFDAHFTVPLDGAPREGRAAVTSTFAFTEQA